MWSPHAAARMCLAALLMRSRDAEAKLLGAKGSAVHLAAPTGVVARQAVD
jgi:hypothetical protein